MGLELHHIPRKENLDADALAKMAVERKPVPSGVFVNDLNMPSVREKPPTADKTLAGKTEHAVKIEHAPTDPAPDRALGGPQCLAAGQPDPDQANNTDWRADLLAYLLQEVLPEEQNAARRIARRAKMFAIIDGELYKRSPSDTGILMKCISVAQGKEFLLEIHIGICGHHAVQRSLVGKAFRQGFYWPTALRNAE